MIVFDLACDNNHRFEGWFSSNQDFARQTRNKLVACPVCGSASVVRLPHAPHIGGGGKERAARTQPATRTHQQYVNIGTDVLAKLVEHIVENTEDVGADFPEQARKIHYREAPERHIRGTASSEEVEALKEEGIEVVALSIPAYRLGKTH